MDDQSLEALMQSELPKKQNQAVVLSQLKSAKALNGLSTVMHEHQNATTSMLGQLKKALSSHEKTTIESLGSLTDALSRADAGARRAASASSKLTAWLVVATIAIAIATIAQAIAAALPYVHPH